MSHITGTLQTLSTPLTIGPDAGTSSTTFHPDPAPAPGGLKFAILHFTSASFPGANRLEVDLGYDTDIFTAADGTDFWTRPVNVNAFPGGNIPIRYITSGASTGSVQLVAYGRGERHAGWQDPSALSNCDPFLLDATYVEPIYDPFWFCHPPNPDWENMACTPAADIKSKVAKSVGMIVHVYYESHVSAFVVSTCSVTLIGADLVILAGHCIADDPVEIGSASVIFNYQTECGGTRPAAYNGMFYKVKKLVRLRWQDPTYPDHDYCILQLKTPPGGIPLTPISMRHDLPGPGEQVFGVHHPNGAIKKLSRKHTEANATVTASSATSIRCDIDVSGGSSGSGIFDLSGRIMGVLSAGFSCSLSYFPTATILQDVAAALPSPARDVILVFDKSGSMSSPAGTGKTKIEEARDAASLFVQLIATASGHRIGLVTFSTSSPVPPAPADFAVTPVTPASKNALIGPSPFSGGIVGGIAPGGTTTIGGGLQSALLYFPASGANRRTILLMTDGLQNTPPMIDTVEPSLTGIDINVIGFGTASSLDGTLLSRLSERHNGIYTRAGDPLALKKFFAMAFGNIFESGTLSDPNYFLAANQMAAKPVPFDVCGEETITIVAGWDKPASQLYIEVITPAGNSILPGTAGTETSTGNTWTFVKLNLPHNGERDGAWRVVVHRVRGGGEFPPPQVDLNYFINIVVKGGPVLYSVGKRKKYYTGDTINPMLVLRYEDGTFPPNIGIKLTVTRPENSIGNILGRSGLNSPVTIGGDTIPSRQATLAAMETQSGVPAINYRDETYELRDDPANTGGFFESPGLLGRVLNDVLQAEGDYHFRAVATYGDGCTATRELHWSLHVDCGIDPSRTTIETTVLATLPDGTQRVSIRITPRDSYNNNLGPGRGGDINVTGTNDSTITEPLSDNGDGSYTVIVIWNPTSGSQPGVVIGQPDRPSMVVTPPCPPSHKKGGKKWKNWFYILLVLLLVLLIILLYLLLS